MKKNEERADSGSDTRAVEKPVVDRSAWCADLQGQKQERDAAEEKRKSGVDGEQLSRTSVTQRAV